MVMMAKGPQQTEGIGQNRFSWFTTFLFAPPKERQEVNVRCFGCRELIKPDYKKPAHISGVIEFNGLYIPVIDPAVLLTARPSTLSNLSCILIIPHSWEYQHYDTGFIIEDIDEIMELASNVSGIEPSGDTSINIRFILDLRKSSNAESWLYENHRMLDICRNESEAERDYIVFRRICSKQHLSA